MPKIERALTICDPFAWLIVSDCCKKGFCTKPVENRTWATGQRGTIVVHASSSTINLRNPDLEAMICDIHPEIKRQLMLPDDGDCYVLHPGCVVGVVDIIDCLAYDAGTQDFEQVCRDAGHGAWYDAHPIPPAFWAEGPFCYILENPRQIVRPFKWKGALNFWHVKPLLLAEITKALAGPLGSPWEYQRAIVAGAKK